MLHRGLGCRSSFRAVGGEELHHSFHSLQHSFTRLTTVGRCYMLNITFTFRDDRLAGLFFGYFLLRSKRLNTRNLKFHMLVRLCSSILMKDLFAVLGQYLSKDSSLSSIQTVFLTVVLQDEYCKSGGDSWNQNKTKWTILFSKFGVKDPTWLGRDHLTRRFPAGWISSVSQCSRLKLKGRISFDI